MPNFKERGYRLQQSRCGIWQCFQLPVLLIDNCNLVLRQWLCHWSNCMLYMIVTLLAWLDLFLGCACMCPSSVYWIIVLHCFQISLYALRTTKFVLFWFCDNSDSVTLSDMLASTSMEWMRISCQRCSMWWVCWLSLHKLRWNPTR